MSAPAAVYAQALYELARDRKAEDAVLQQLHTLRESFSREPRFARLLSAPQLSKPERQQVLAECFAGKLESCLLHFLQLLVDKGQFGVFSDCTDAYVALHDRDHNILPVTAVTAVPLTPEQSTRLREKLEKLTGKTVRLTGRVDPGCIGGVQLRYDGLCVDDTLRHRLDSIRASLSQIAL